MGFTQFFLKMSQNGEHKEPYVQLLLPPTSRTRGQRNERPHKLVDTKKSTG